MADLYKKLAEYSETDFYPYHMPGHKRRLGGKVLAPVANLDITEIDGFDNLHDATGILQQIQQKAAAAYGAEESFYLVGGSTAGILGAVSAAVPEGGKLLMVRGCHRSVYHGAYLRKLKVEYLWTGVHPDFGCNLPADAEMIERALLEDAEIGAVLIVSPTYEGLTADVGKIAEIVHKRGIPLIVDEAHGAHLGFHPAWSQNSSRRGADLVIQSLHKTLPSPTQTAILHVSGQLINRTRLKRFLRIYQSSSPSYLFMAAMEEAIDMTATQADSLFGAFLENWNHMLQRLANCKCLQILQVEGMDIGKLVVRDTTGQLSGQELYDRLLHRYHLQMEMAAGCFVLAMFTIGDTPEGYERLTEDLLEIDAECARNMGEESVSEQESVYVSDSQSVPEPRQVLEPRQMPEQETDCQAVLQTRQETAHDCQQEVGTEWNHEAKQEREQAQCHIPPCAFPLEKAWDAATESILLTEAEGRIAGDFINLYPPGIPLLVPGEIFTKEIVSDLQRYVCDGLTVQGAERNDDKIYVQVLK